MDLGLKGKRVLVAAASSGIGYATAQLFLKEGSKVAICSHNPQKLKTAAERLEKETGNKPLALECDLTSNDQIDRFIACAKEHQGPAEIVVSNTGGPPPGLWNELDLANWQKAYQLVLGSAMRLTEQAVPEMQKARWGRILFVSSVSAWQPITMLAPSSTYRAGLLGYAKVVANDVGKFGITVNTVLPGYTMTDRQTELAEKTAQKTGMTPKDILAGWAEANPLKRTGRPEEIAAGILFLASSQADYITGAVLPIDGGRIQSIA